MFMGQMVTLLAGCTPHAMHATFGCKSIQLGQPCMQLAGTHQSCPMTKRAQNMVPCANQYAGHAHLQPQKGKLSCSNPCCSVRAGAFDT